MGFFPGIPAFPGLVGFGGNALNAGPGAAQNDNVVPPLATAPAEVQVTFGSVTFDDNDAQYKFLGNNSVFTDYEIHNRYESDKHIYMMGITSPGGFQGASVAFCQLASPTLLWMSDWTACKTQGPPESPDPTPIDPNWILMDVHYEPAMINIMADGVTPIYRISGTYVYGHRNPSPLTIQNIAFSRPPWLQDSFSRTMPANLLQQDIINIQGAAGAPGAGGQGQQGGVLGVPNPGPGVP